MINGIQYRGWSLPSAAALLLLFTAACGGLSPQNVTDHDGVVAENLGAEVNSSHDDYAMVLYRDRLLFTSDRPTVEGYIQGDDFWFTDREFRSWTKSLNYGGKINTDRDEGSPFITNDSEWIYFVQCDTEDGLGDCDIYAARMDYNGKWQEIRNLGDGVNSKYWDSQPFLSPDGEFLYFASDRPGGEGGTDIWRARLLRNGRWGRPQNLGSEINTGGDEKAPTVAPNGEDLYFSSTGHPSLGGHDLFRSTVLRRNKWTPVENIGKPFNSPEDDMFFRLSPREDTVFIASARAGGQGALDLYAVWPNPFKDSTRYIYWVRGVVYDTISEMGIARARIRVEPADASPFTVTANVNGRFEFRTELDRSYRMSASAEGYETASVDITVPDFLYYNEYRKSIGLAPLITRRDTGEEDDPDRVPPDLTVAYFEFDRSEVLPEYRTQLQELYKEKIQPLMEAGKTVTVTLDAHTDDRGTEEYNYQLSRRRGMAVSRVLRDLGVPLDAIIVNAYGETRPADPSRDENAWSKNRRVEVRISSAE